MPDVDIDLIKPSPYQPRLFFELEELKKSIEQDGMLVNILVRENPDGQAKYELIDGERRWRSAQELNWKQLPIDIKNVDDETARRMVYTLNEERQPYTLEENTKFFRRMYEQMGTVLAVSQAFNRPNSTIWRYINVSMLPEYLQKAVWAGKIKMGEIEELEPLFAEARDEIGNISYVGNYEKSPTYRRIVAGCEAIYKEEIKGREKVRQYITDPYLEALDRARVERTKDEIEAAAPTPADFPEATVKLETPEDFDRLAKNLKQKAKRMRREAMTPEEILKEEEEKQRKKRDKEEEKRQEELRLLEAETIETATTKEEVERAKAKLRELVPDDKRTELEEVLATSDLSVGILEKLPDSIRREPDRPIIEIARGLHIDSTPGIGKSRRVMQPKPELSLSEYVDEVTKTGYRVMDLLKKMAAGNFRQIAPKFEILRIDEMLFALDITVKKYRGGQKGEGGNDA